MEFDKETAKKYAPHTAVGVAIVGALLLYKGCSGSKDTVDVQLPPPTPGVIQPADPNYDCISATDADGRINKIVMSTLGAADSSKAKTQALALVSDLERNCLGQDGITPEKIASWRKAVNSLEGDVIPTAYPTEVPAATAAPTAAPSPYTAPTLVPTKKPTPKPTVAPTKAPDTGFSFGDDATDKNPLAQ